MSTLYVDNIYSKTGTSQALEIDSSGRVTTPARPAFCVRWSSSQTGLSATGYNRLNFDNEVFDIGGNVSSGVFTTPVSGVYHFNLSQRIDSVGTGFLIIVLSNHASTLETASDLFNSSYRIEGAPAPNFKSMQTSITIKLPASYVVAPWYYMQSDTSYTLSTTGAQFSGYLVG